MKRRFDSFRVSNLEFLQQRDSQIPLVVYANHSSWQDGLAAFEISRRAQLDSFVMMEKKQLKNCFFFDNLARFRLCEKSRAQQQKVSIMQLIFIIKYPNLKPATDNC